MAVFKKVWSITSTVLVVLVVACALLLMGSRLLGYQVYTVISGSMEPTYSVGDLLYVQKVDPSTIKEGDPITFMINEGSAIATHRVVSVEKSTEDNCYRFTTKGDANKDVDSEPVHQNNVVGVPRFAIPKVGYISNYVQHPPGIYLAVGLGLLLVVSVFLPDLFGSKKKKNPELTTVEEEVSTASAENERLKAELEKLRTEIAEVQATDGGASDSADTEA